MTMLPSEIETAAENERARLEMVPKWRAAFTGTSREDPLLVEGTARNYFIVEFRRDDRTTGLMLFNSDTGKIAAITGVQRLGEAMYRFYRPEEIPPLLDGRSVKFPRKQDYLEITLVRGNVTVKPSLYWVPCDQSLTRFQPLYVVDHTNAGVTDTLWVRVDGEIFTRITTGGAGM